MRVVTEGGAERKLWHCRQAAAVDKRRKLSDPNNFVSSTRLSVRNMPTATDEKELRVMVTEMVGQRAQIKQVKQNGCVVAVSAWQSNLCLESDERVL